MAAFAPSVVLTAIADTLRQELGDLVQEVRPHDGNFGVDGKNNVTIPSPGVLICSTGGTLDANGHTPSVAVQQYAAFVITRTPDRERAKQSKGDLAMDLAWAIAAIVERELWDGHAAKEAERVRVINEHTNGLDDKGVSVWTVTWLQQAELPPRDGVRALLNRLRRIHFDFHQGDVEQTPQHEAMVELSGAELPEEAA